ncbi:hypothetical protein [Streptomyces europaeiscabiei]|uniref:hypothetical protein n=1 Tax=Streptomyces europaeiscabiei TaxID=146819 RepID=UPI002E2E8715|nr:hypothetical protein [Streptomyces europaeiscabiei]
MSWTNLRRATSYRQVAVTQYDSEGNPTGSSAVFRAAGAAGSTSRSSPTTK